MNRITFKLAASTVIVSLTLGGTIAQSQAIRGASVVRADDQAARDAARLADDARRAIARGDLAEALVAIENAVARSPQDSGYRLLLADVYLKSGRFDSAGTTYADVLELDGSNVRARLSLALTQIAAGRPQAAIPQLEEIEGRASAADVGLAYALAGLPDRAVRLLEPAARVHGADARTRQNLALALALSGDWRRARIVAAQDVSPADLDDRMRQWASFASPDASPIRIAGLLGVQPAQDNGQPARLALAPRVEAQAFAEAEDQVPEPSPVEVAMAEPAPPEVVDTVSDWGEPAEPQEASLAESRPHYLPPPPAPVEAPSVYAAAAESIVRPTRHTVADARVALPPPPVFRPAVSRPAPQARSPAPRATAPIAQGSSRFVVQLGAFSNEGNAERAWQEARSRFGLSGKTPLTTTYNHGGRTLHRVSFAGFASQSDAQRQCAGIRSRGGACFVRANAGDASIRWAARYAPGRARGA